MLSPITPHISHCLWRQLGNDEAIIDVIWPEANEELQKDKTINLVVQVNGKLRANIDVDLNTTQKEIEKLALKHDNIKKHIEGKEVNRLIYIPSKLLNIVVS